MDDITKPKQTTDRQGFSTRAIHAGQSPDPSTGAIMSLSDYRSMVEDTPIDTRLVEFRDDIGRLVACVLTDWSDDGISAVYSFFDPEQPARSLGSYMIVWLLREAARSALPYVYLGYWVGGSRKMGYKTRFRPIEGFGPQGWQRIA